MLKLSCQAQNYAWGRLPSAESEVAALVAASGVPVDQKQPYAELWMGTHPNAPSMLVTRSMTLQEWLDKHPMALGPDAVAQFGADLPFLFKVLSVGTALSIQSHPDKALAERLHAKEPKVYKDDNHKPEMAIALTDFEALCAFVTTAELDEAFRSTPELCGCCGDKALAAVRDATSPSEHRSALQAAFTALMLCDAAKVRAAIEALVRRLKSQGSGGRLSEKEALVLRLNEQYPGDVGVLSAYFLNLVRLRPGQAIYLAANEPHAYVAGELIECMATSDNVIRAGLTPKLRDTEVLCSSLTYNQGPPTILEGEEVQQYTRVYSPPFDEFEVFHIALPAGKATIIPANPGPTILLVQEGKGSATAVSRDDVVSELSRNASLSKGCVFFVPAGTSLEICCRSQTLKLWIAAVNGRVFDARFRVPTGKENVANGILV